jgi:Rieske Fe-S protein
MNKLTRREFLKYAGRFLAVAGTAAIFAPVISFFFPSKLEDVPSEPVLVSGKDDLPVGESKMVQYGRYPALVLNTPDGLRAYSAVCTHFACLVKWDPEEGKIVCPCHDAAFDPLDGSVLSGPPPAPLKALQVEIVSDEIYVGGTS